MLNEETISDEEQPEPEPSTIVFCVERGRLEQEALVMLESLRRWGGELGRSRVIGVTPRRDQPLRRETIAALESFEVELHDASAENSMPWYPYFGKIAAVKLAERAATTPVVIWLDCDVVVLQPLRELGLPHGDDFTARREPAGYHLLESGSEQYIDYWRWACEVVGLDWEEIPWCLADDPWPRQMLVFNAGIFAFRRGRGFPEAYEDTTRRLIRANVAYDGDRFRLNEQTALGLTMQRLGLRFRELSRREHYMISHDVHGEKVFGGPLSPPGTRLVHYSHARQPQFWDRLLTRFEKEFPDHLEWLRSKGPLESEARPRDPIILGRRLRRKCRWALQGWKCRRAVAARERRGAGMGRTP